MKDKIKKIIVQPESGLGDAIYLTSVLKAIKKALPKKDLIVKAGATQKILLEGLLKENNGFLEEIVDINYQAKSHEYEINLSGYLNRNQSITGTNYLVSLIEMAEEQLNHIYQGIELDKNSDPVLYFSNVPGFQRHMDQGKRKIQEIREAYGDKPIIWLGARTSGSINRMPQSYTPQKNFWHNLIDSSKNKFVFYELRAYNQEPIDERVEPKKDEDNHFASHAQIIRESSAGIGLDGMQRAFADALGKKKMIVLLGPTHPRAIVKYGDEAQVLTIPSLEEYDSLNYCRGCSMVGYSSPNSFKQREEAMKGRFSLDFVLDANKDCRILKDREHHYDCWSSLNAEEVLKKLHYLINS